MKINLFDSCIGEDLSITHGRTPKNIEYIKTDHNPDNIDLYTNFDMFTRQVPEQRKHKSYGWLFESVDVVPDAFVLMPRIVDKFTTIFTYYIPFIQWLPEKFQWAPAMGSWIGGKPDGLGGGKIGITEKSKLVSMICSNKTFTRGHQLRRQVADHLLQNNKRVDVFGLSERFSNVYDVTAPYMFQVVIENGCQPGYFTEKLLNCLAVGTIPIYYGSKTIKDYFDIRGIISLEDYLNGKVILNEELYNSLKEYANINFAKMQEYDIPEDYIYKKYLELD